MYKERKRNNDLRGRVLRCLCEAFQLQLLPNRQKVVQAVFLDLNFPVVDEVHHRYQICSLRLRVHLYENTKLNQGTPSVPSEAMAVDGHCSRDLEKMCLMPTGSPEL